MRRSLGTVAEELPDEYIAGGIKHTGVLFVPRSLPNEDFAGIAAAIVRFDHQYPEGVPPCFVGYLIARRR